MGVMSADQGIYRRVSVRLWADEKVRRLSPLQPSAQALWLYLLTGPHTGPIPGVFTCGRAAMAEALDWSLEEFSRCLAELTEAGMAEYDHEARLWFIPRAIRHNPPASPNVVRGWRAAWVLLPEGHMRDRIANGIAQALEGLTEAFREAFREALAESSSKASSRPLPNQEQEQEQEEKTPARKRAADPPGFDEFWNAWPVSARKQDRKKCAAKWQRCSLGAKLPEILAHLQAMKGTKGWQEGFEPAPLTYLNGERWNDGMPPAGEAQRPSDGGHSPGPRRPALDTDFMFGHDDQDDAPGRRRVTDEACP